MAETQPTPAPATSPDQRPGANPNEPMRPANPPREKEGEQRDKR